MLPEMFLIRNVILACWLIFSTLYMGKSLGKQDHCDLRHSDERWLELIIAMLICRHYKLHLHFDIVKNFREFKKICDLDISWKLVRLQCFDAVGWAAGRASGL